MAEKQCNLLKNGGGTDIKHSTAEHIIGKVNENGTIKDLYEKTINGSVTNKSLDVSLGISSISKVYEINGGVVQSSPGAVMVPAGFTNIATGQYVAVFVNLTALTVGLRVADMYVGYDYKISVIYTKN